MSDSDREGQVTDAMERFWGALEIMDYPTAYSLLTDDAVIWHCHDNLVRSAYEVIGEEETRDAPLPKDGTPRKHYNVTYRRVVGDECFQAQVCEVPTPAGLFEIPMFVRCVCPDGKISRIDEYWDSGRVKEFQAAMRPSAAMQS
jgi:hypothetical protein